MTEVFYINLADLVDPHDPHGRTYRQVNAARQHQIPIGALVELDSGVRLFVAAHRRDCDQEPLYSLIADPDGYEWNQVHGYGEEGLTVIRPAPSGTAGGSDE